MGQYQLKRTLNHPYLSIIHEARGWYAAYQRGTGIFFIFSDFERKSVHLGAYFSLWEMPLEKPRIRICATYIRAKHRVASRRDSAKSSTEETGVEPERSRSTVTRTGLEWGRGDPVIITSLHYRASFCELQRAYIYAILTTVIREMHFTL